MASKITKASVTKAMKSLGTYKTEFDESINRYVALQTEYKALYQEYENSDYQCFVATATGLKKHPLVTTLESLRKDLLQLESELGLTPRGLLKLNDAAFEVPKQSSVKDSLI